MVSSQLCQEHSLPPEVKRRRTIARVQRAVLQDYGLNYVVKEYGSGVYGVGTPTSDLDLTILVTTLVLIATCCLRSFTVHRMANDQTAFHPM